MNDFKKDKEIMELINDYKDICKQIKKPEREKMEKVLISVSNNNLMESLFIEMNEGPLTNIKNISTSILYRKLPKYKKLCSDKLKLKLGEELFNEIVKEVENENN